MAGTLGRGAFLAIAALFVGACGTGTETREAERAESLEQIRATIAASGAEVGLFYLDLGPEPDSLLIAADLRMHAASTMKVPVMMQLHLDQQLGTGSLDDRVRVTNTFLSIVDGSSYDLPLDSDSDSILYGRIGQEVSVREMIDRMITWSSNLATNLLIQRADPGRINRMLASIGADSMDVVRGVEDLKAFQAGLSNTTTARALGRVMAEVAMGAMFDEARRAEMIEVLERQHFRDGIPAGLPTGTRVANKTGWITGIQHDAAIIYPANASPYVLVVMVRGHPASDQGTAMAAELSRLVWAYHGGGDSPD